MSDGFNSIRMKDVLPDLFAKLEHFSGQAYYDEMVRLFPQFKADGDALIPSEKEMERWMLEENEFSVIEGKTSLPQAEQALGVKIGEDYVYPNGMTDFEYNLNRVYKMGLLHYTDHCDFEQVVEFMEMAEAYTDEEDGERFSAELKAAYVCAWQNLHFHNYDEKDRVLTLQDDFNELCTLNPQLKCLKFNTNDVLSLNDVCAGVSFGFPVEDIQLFVSSHENGVLGVAKSEHARIKQDAEREGLPQDFKFGWVPSTETIKAIGEKLREKEKAAQLKNGAEKVWDGLLLIYDTVQEYEPSATDKLMRAYLKNDEKMMQSAFWEQCAKNVIAVSEVEESIILADFKNLGDYIAKDMTENMNDKQYQSVKRKCVQAEDFVQEAQKAVRQSRVVDVVKSAEGR